MSLFSQTGPYYGTKPPRMIKGASYIPCGYAQTDTGFSTTATRVYYTPRIVFQARSIPSVQIINSGVGDNGEHFRIMTFYDDATDGGPGTLAKDWGEITLTGASAIRTLTPASPFSAPQGIVWDAVWAESASAVYGMSPYTFATNAGFSGTPSMQAIMGQFTAPAGNFAQTYAHYVDTTYGAAPATAVAPTASIIGSYGAGAPVVPAIWWKA